MISVIPYPNAGLREAAAVSVPLRFMGTGSLADTAKRLNDTILRVHGCPSGEGGIVLEEDPTLAKEGYRLTLLPGPVLAASGYEGFCRGAATLILTAKDGRTEFTETMGEDAPAVGFRGLMVDLARHWHPMEQVLSFMDACFAMKLNVLHLHFTDDQLYTLPSEAFPKLGEPGTVYTREEIALLNERARNLGITILPEIDLPGHAGSFLRAYPEVFGTRPMSDRALCMGRESVYEAVDTLIGEIVEMFPDSPMIHIGGDEVQDAGWKTCEDSAAYMREHGIADVKALYSHAVGRIARMVLKYGRRPVAWEGFPPAGAHEIPRETLIMPFECAYYDPRALVKDGFELVNASWKPLYYTRDIFWPWCDIVGDWDLGLWKDWVSFSDAYPEPIRVEETDKILGAQIYCWGPGYEEEWHPVVRACLGLSERLWRKEPACTPEDLQPRLNRVKAVIDRLHV